MARHGDVLRLVPTTMAAGGAAVAREATGRVVLVEGPCQVKQSTRSSPRNAPATPVLASPRSSSPQPDRVAPPCPHVARGCGGCGWQHVSLEAQRRYKTEVVSEVLERIGGLEGADVVPAPPASLAGYRTTLRLSSDGARPGFRRHRGHEVVPVDTCLVAHPCSASCSRTVISGRRPTLHFAAGPARANGWPFSGRAQRAPLCQPGPRIGQDELAAGRRAWIFEEVAGKRLRLSAESFFQASPEGAEVLVSLVASAVTGAPEGLLVDAYGGVGLFAAAIAEGRPVTVLESSAAAAADARVNLPGASVRRIDVARWRASKAAVVVADPPRAGLGAAGVAALVATRASHLALVSCDPASLGRDAALLQAQGLSFGLGSTRRYVPGHASHRSG